MKQKNSHKSAAAASDRDDHEPYVGSLDEHDDFYGLAGAAWHFSPYDFAAAIYLLTPAASSSGGNAPTAFSAAGPAPGAAATPTLNLTHPGSDGVIGGAIYSNAVFEVASRSVTGFLKLDDSSRFHNAQGFPRELGYNSDARPQFDEDNPVTKALATSAVPVAYVGQTPYLEFRLEIDEGKSAASRYLSLDQLKIYITNDKDLSAYPFEPSHGGAGSGQAQLVYDLDQGPDRWVALNANPPGSSGFGEVSVFVAADRFYDIGDSADRGSWVAKADYITLFSEFGLQGTTTSAAGDTTFPTGTQQWIAQGGAEQWVRGVDGALQVATIRGYVFEDVNGDGQDQGIAAGEEPMSGVTIYLDANNDGLLSPGELSTMTNASGVYQFTDLVAGLGGDRSTYYVREIVPDNHAATAPVNATDQPIALTAFEGNHAPPPPVTVDITNFVPATGATIEVDLSAARYVYNLPSFGNEPPIPPADSLTLASLSVPESASDAGCAADHDHSATIDGNPTQVESTDGGWLL